MSNTVKLVIKIPKETKQAFDKADSNDLKGGYYDQGGVIGKAIQNGIPLNKVLDKMGAKVIFNHADFRLMSARALQAFAEFKETYLFLRGMVPMVGYKSDIVTYERSERLAGESKYPLKKMLALAWEGITSLSTKPIKLITRLGLIIFLISIVMLIYTLVRFFMGATETGWASLAVSIWAIGGLQMMAIGIIGEYIGKIYLEAKRRPRYIVEEYLHD